MEQKYSVPALDRAHAVLTALTDETNRWKLSELAKKLNISKSTLYSLLQTMERLQWVSRDRNETYAVGTALGRFGSGFFRQYDLIEEFRRLAEPVMHRLQESIQLAVLEGADTLYLAKVAAPSPVQMVSGPGARFPAHATGLGKSLLSGMDEAELRRLFPEETLPKITVHTIGSREALAEELKKVRLQGHATDIQEGIMGFCCVAAPVQGAAGSAAAAVSCSMPVHHWEGKRDAALKEMIGLAARLSPGG
ncbi:IclR family transcriptional regulator [Paenibacillus sp. MWE-103]|uniref:IclR family transcriptional regulator n=1 Tax=Paenibacillus artemisiicola TaxID=1172618 RepID=A0ABS3W5C9_9BACL|nr:IclR family transcriptional regulator [Paenibacillus artemisiicola]MBO7743522.1 IclR family transcriptional regulator [Paenibacillus artemisiicola]